MHKQTVKPTVKSARLAESLGEAPAPSGEWSVEGPGGNHVYKLSLGGKSKSYPGWGLGWGCYQAEETAVAEAPCEEED